MMKVQEERSFGTIIASKGKKSKANRALLQEDEVAADIRAVERDSREAEEQERIRRKVEKLKSIQERRLQKHRKQENMHS